MVVRRRHQKTYSRGRAGGCCALFWLVFVLFAGLQACVLPLDAGDEGPAEAAVHAADELAAAHGAGSGERHCSDGINLWTDLPPGAPDHPAAAAPLPVAAFALISYLPTLDIRHQAGVGRLRVAPASLRAPPEIYLLRSLRLRH